MIKAFFPAKTERIFHRGKYGNVYRLDSIERVVQITNRLRFEKGYDVREVDVKDDSLLKIAHSPNLINSYLTGKPIKLAQGSGILWQDDFYPWLVNKSWSSVLATKEALESGRSIAIQDGGHHAEYASGHGFGPINNMVIAAKYLLENKVAKKICILDLDVHYANGTHSLVENNDRILSLDLWKYKLDKWKFTRNSKNILGSKVNKVAEYFTNLKILLHEAERFNPDIVLYYLGLDVLNSDRIGGISGFNSNILLKREQMVAKFVEDTKLPICIYIGGGYIDHSEPEAEVRKKFKHLIDLYLRSIKILTS